MPGFSLSHCGAIYWKTNVFMLLEVFQAIIILASSLHQARACSGFLCFHALLEKITLILFCFSTAAKTISYCITPGLNTLFTSYNFHSYPQFNTISNYITLPCFDVSHKKITLFPVLGSIGIENWQEKLFPGK